MAVDNRNTLRAVLLGIAVLAVVLRLAFALGYWTGQPLTGDEREYLSLARGLAAGHGFVYDDVAREGGVDPFGRAPGYPAFLALIGAGRTVTADVPAVVQVVQSLVRGHPAYVVVFLSGTRLKATTPDGKTREGDRKAGEVLWSEAATHALENVGTTDQHIVIELKQ